MSVNRYSVFVGTGSYVPTRIIKNEEFITRDFFNTDGTVLDKPGEEIVTKFEEITGIFERRYVTEELVASDIAGLAAEDALVSSGIDRESLDYVIVAHNFGDVQKDNRRSDFVPSLAARVKHKLGIKKPETVAYDVPFGCPGWMIGVFHADSFLKLGRGKRALVIGSETLSRISDPHDRDSMLYSDGAGAVIMESVEHSEPIGILTSAIRSDTQKHCHMLWMDRSYNPDYPKDDIFLKMQGHKLYKYALKTVPRTVAKSLELAGLKLEDISKILIHQANEKMDREIVKRLFAMQGYPDVSDAQIAAVMPMIISWLGNNSVATVPTLLDFLFKGKLDRHEIQSGEHMVLASVGAGMNVTSMVYKMPS